MWPKSIKAIVLYIHIHTEGLNSNLQKATAHLLGRINPRWNVQRHTHIFALTCEHTSSSQTHPICHILTPA